MSPADRDTDPTPVAEPPPLPLPPPLPGARAQRSTLSGKAKRWAGYALDKLVPAVTLLLVALLAKCYDEVRDKADAAKKVAGVAAAQGVTGAKVAVATKVEAGAAYDATKEKADDSGRVIEELATRVNELSAEVERLKAERGRPRRRPKPVEVPKTVTEPLPPTPAAAAKEAAAAPAPGGKP